MLGCLKMFKGSFTSHDLNMLQGVSTRKLSSIQSRQYNFRRLRRLHCSNLSSVVVSCFVDYTIKINVFSKH